MIFRVVKKSHGKQTKDRIHFQFYVYTHKRLKDYDLNEKHDQHIKHNRHNLHYKLSYKHLHTMVITTTKAISTVSVVWMVTTISAIL